MKIILLEADYLDPQGATKTLFLATAAYQTTGTDTPVHQPYDDFITDGLVIKSAMDDVLLGATQTYFSDISVVNKIDPEALAGNYSGQQARLYIGEQSAPKAKFNQVFSATIDDLSEKDEQSLSLKLRSYNDVLDQPLQQIAIGDRGKNKPITYGGCINVSPVVVDSATRTYSVNETTISSLSVRAAGVSVSTNNDLANGQFSFNSNQGGTITADVTTSITKAKAIILDILARANITSIDHASLNALPADEMALYLASNETPAQALDAVVNSINWFWAFKRSGEFFVAPFAFTAPVAVLYPGDMQRSGVDVIKTIKPVKKVTMIYQKNWTLQDGSLADAVNLSDRDKYQQKGLAVPSENAAIIAQYPNARTVEKSTLLKEQAAAQNEADKRALLLNQTRRVYQVKAFDRPFSFELGQTITLFYPSARFADGKDVIIVGIEDDLLNEESILQVFC